MGSRLTLIARVGLRYLLTLWLAITGLFLALVILKGNPVELFVDPRISPEEQQALKRAYGYDESNSKRYLRYLTNLVRGEMGVSFTHKQPVGALLWPAGKRSLFLAVFAFGLMVPILFLLLLGQARLSRVRRATRGIVTVLLCLPAFAVAALLSSQVATRIGWLPQYGSGPLFADEGGFWLWERIRYGFLPAFSLALPLAGQFAALLGEQLEKLEDAPFVLSARGRGVGPFRVFSHHQLWILLPTFFQLCGICFPTVAGGAFIVEALFGWSGFGLLLIDAAAARDYPLLIGGCIWCAALVIPAYELADRFRDRLERA